jgi:hypothetical protein
LSALRAGRLYPQEIFLLEAESTPRPQCGLKDYVNDTIGNRTRELPVGIAVLQPTETVVIFWIALPYITMPSWRQQVSPKHGTHCTFVVTPKCEVLPWRHVNKSRGTRDACACLRVKRLHAPNLCQLSRRYTDTPHCFAPARLSHSPLSLSGVSLRNTMIAAAEGVQFAHLSNDSVRRLFFFSNLCTAAFKAYCAIWVRRSNFRHQASPRVSPRESTQRRKVELWARNVR